MMREPNCPETEANLVDALKRERKLNNKLRDLVKEWREKADQLANSKKYYDDALTFYSCADQLEGLLND